MPLTMSVTGTLSPNTGSLVPNRSLAVETSGAVQRATGSTSRDRGCFVRVEQRTTNCVRGLRRVGTSVETR